MDYEEYIKKYFTYENGVLYRHDRKGGNGSFDKDGYLIIKIKGKQFKAHRIVWLLHYGHFPKMEIDHINRIRTDNRIENLRECTRLENIQNSYIPVNKDTGVRGIYKDKCTKGLLAVYTFHKNGKTVRCRTLEEAIRRKKEYEPNNNDTKRAKSSKNTV